MGIEEFSQIVKAGFHCKSAYNPSYWRKVERLMLRLCGVGLVRAYNFGRGKGKFATVNDDMSIDGIVAAGWTALKSPHVSA